MKVIFERPKLFGGFTEAIELDCIPRVGDRIVLDKRDDPPVLVSFVEWYPFGTPEDPFPVVYVSTKKY